ncbi:MAG: hypothetical protein HGA96_14030 [Desulfobulbaceae bacterium]|nr:hypothetical protein [Desulfobulbaceae bacterium]
MKICKLLVFLVVLLGIFSHALAAQDKLCFNCHDKRDFSKPVVHKPVGEGECQRCHNPHVAKIKGLLQDEVRILCLSCHKDIGLVNTPQSVIVHRPVLDGQCVVCHDPHSSSSRGLLRESSQKETCIKCHGELEKNFVFVHQPYGRGECGVCHQPHQSNRQYLLINEPDELCRTCHKGNLIEFHKNFPKKPGACLSCHNPHGSSRKGLIKDFLHEPFKSECNRCHIDPNVKVGTEKCFECHEDVREKALAVNNHLSSSIGNSCTNCHSPHAADGDKFIKSKVEKVCRGCHADTFLNYVQKKHKHPHIEGCMNCHEVHGSNNLAMLKGDGNQVCNSCHKTQGQFTHPVGDGVFDPRTGVIMTCVSCHYPHGTDYPFNLKMEGSKDLCIQCHRGY